ncbi:MAG TPA: hypothetical protein GXX70_04655 [Tepidimicrobium sp.]|nr:hypothetical protein [Tepidimicrobium sp.]
MDIDMDYIVKLYSILKGNGLDKKELDAFIKTKGGKKFIKYEGGRDRKTSRKRMERELGRVVADKNYEDEYRFNNIRSRLDQLKRDMDYIENNRGCIIDEALSKVYKIVPRHMTVKANIYLYAGGTNAGFTLNRRNVFINYGKYIGRMNDFIGILSHELYHCRRIPLENRIKCLLSLGSRWKRAIYEIIGRSIEEGIACLVQHGPVLKNDDLINGLTRRNLLLRKGQFDLLSNILLDIKGNKLDYETISKLNMYIIGYHIISTIYNWEGILILDHWTEHLRYDQIMKRYINICEDKDMATGFTREIEEWILKMD